MAATMQNPTQLSLSTTFAPSHQRTFSRSRSPSRSPARKAQFAARELDPLLRNLSPDSTLAALQETSTLGGSQAEQDALARSIADASTAERELGIRAAIAAKKLREWLEELSAWPWPKREDRGWGAGFIAIEKDGLFVTSLQKGEIIRYEERLDEIWDAIETLGLDELKQFVFSFHQPSSAMPGHLRDFTALITATVVQSLPTMANLHVLLESWSMRLTILKQIPDLLLQMQRVKVGLVEINAILQDQSKSRRLNRQELFAGKAIFGNKVSNLGSRVDQLLDMLMGQEDSLPQAWIDSLEDIENKYAEWVARAEQIVLRNEMDLSPAEQLSVPKDPSRPFASPSAAEETVSIHELEALPVPPKVFLTVDSAQTPQSHRELPTETGPTATNSHRRGISEISMASGLSDYSENAEIVDTKRASILPSPRISIINPSLPPSRHSSMNLNNYASSPSQFSAMHLSSRNSIEVIPKGIVRQVSLQRSASQDVLAQPPTILRRESRDFPTNQNDLSSSPKDILPLKIKKNHSLPLLTQSTSSDFRAGPADDKPKQMTDVPVHRKPLVPRRSSKRLTSTMAATERTENSSSRVATFDDRLKEVLSALPANIQLANSESGESSKSVSSTRASSPVQTIKLSPVKDARGQDIQPGGIRVYHLSRSGKDAPVKLFVRAVGEYGERLMVRVGGGWADLAEYLREYSSHHGGTGFAETEVVDYPYSNGSSHKQGKSADSIGFDFGFDKQSLEKSRSENESSTPNSRPISRLDTPNSSSTTTSQRTGVYTPLGAAGPVSKRINLINGSSSKHNEAWVHSMVNQARSVSGSAVAYRPAGIASQHSPATNVFTSTIQGPTTTTTTTITAKPGRRVASLGGKLTPTAGLEKAPSPPKGGLPTLSSFGLRPSAITSPAGSLVSESNSSADSGHTPKTGRSKNRISFDDVGGIRRVFLRKKSDR